MENNYKNGIQAEVNDLSFQIHLRLQLSQGAEWVAAIGYPKTSTNHAAIKCWVFENYEKYERLEHQKKNQLMLDDVKSLIKNYITGEGSGDFETYI